METLQEQFWKIYKSKDTCEIVLERPNFVVRFSEYGEDYLTYVEFICPDIDTNRWKYLFKNFTAEDAKIVKECQLAATLHIEEGHETSIRVLRFPIVAERAAINTQFNLLDYEAEG